MSGRVCLLCEKPLGRSWLGAGEDFCSREHRNQYRLRRGMDRLLEANKVANLMRRRESPKPITVFRAIQESDIPRRGIFDIHFSVDDREPLAPPHWNTVREGRETIGLPPTRHLVDALAAGHPRPLPPLQEAPAPPLGMDLAEACMPRPPRQPYPRVVQAGPATAHEKGSHGACRQRDAGVIWKSSRLLHLDPNHHVASGSFRPYEEPHGCCDRLLAGPRGYSLRVSLGAGFRVQPPRLRAIRLELPLAVIPAGPGRVEVLPEPRLGRLQPQSPAAPPPVRMNPAVPKLHWSKPEARMEWPGIILPSVDSAHEGVELSVRPLPGAFTGFPPTFPPPSKHGGRDRARLRRPRLIPAGPPPAAIVTYVPIGCMTDGIDARPGVPQDSRSSVEERFDDGWHNWTGNYHSWTVDAAGARTGALALYAPSMEWRDYELEFFTRIETHSVNFVYRAVSMNDYYMATLAALPGKGYAFTRRTVLRGKPGAALTAPFSILPNPKSAYLVRLRIAGNQFTLWIDGQKIETWTDNRFSMGGTGFIGAPDDRARIYWVRFYPGASKESLRK